MTDGPFREEGKVLGQDEVATSPSWTVLYTVATSRQARCFISMCNRSGASRTASIRIRPLAEVGADKHTVAFQVPLVNGTPIQTREFFITETTIVEGNASGADVNMMVNGEEYHV